jgi:hypothetical protein
MTVIQEQEDVFHVDVNLSNTTVKITLPKHLLPRNRSGAFLGTKENSAEIMT